MKNWNDIYQSVKAGEMDEKLKMMGCEDKGGYAGDAVLSAWSNRDLR